MIIQLTDELRVNNTDIHNWTLEYWNIPKGKGGKPPKGEPGWKPISYHSLATSAIKSGLDHLSKQEGSTYTLEEFKHWYNNKLKEINDGRS